ncbi:hypothetical protein HAX54_035056, partial [Datura stramonium]|nr:hypothetical protein [Datura stramonium]
LLFLVEVIGYEIGLVRRAWHHAGGLLRRAAGCAEWVAPLASGHTLWSHAALLVVQ